MKRVIWSSMPEYEDWRDYLDEEYPGFSDDQKRNLMYEINGEYLEDERCNLDIKLENPIVLIADIGKWNGRFSGYGIIKSCNIRDCLQSEMDDAMWFVDRYKNLRCTAYHHDGTNYYLYREFKPGVSNERIENFLYKIYEGTVTKRDISTVTRRIGDKICAVYGWG